MKMQVKSSLNAFYHRCYFRNLEGRQFDCDHQHGRKANTLTLYKLESCQTVFIHFGTLIEVSHTPGFNDDFSKMYTKPIE